MKKIFCILTVFAFSLFFCLSCEKASNPVESDISSEEGIMKLAKKPPKVKASIDELTVDGTVLIFEDEAIFTKKNLDSHPTVDISNGAEIYYHVTASEDINFVRLSLWYDANANSETKNHEEGDDGYLETLSQIEQYSYEGENDMIVVRTLNWNGSLKAFGSVDRSVYLDDNYMYNLFDKLATYDYRKEVEPFVFPHDMDHYMLWIEVWTDCCTRLASKKVYFWITGAVDRSNTKLIVQSIHFEFETVKNKIIPTAFVKVRQVDGFTIQNAYIYGRWEGLVEGVSPGGPSNAEGLIVVVGDSFRKNKSGILRFIVSTIHHKTGVYDPWSNILGDWPTVRPMREENFPQ